MPFHRPRADQRQPRRERGLFSAYVEAEKYLQIALMLPAAAFVGWAAGAWLDYKLHLKWLGAAGVVFGCLAGVCYVVRMALAYVRAPQAGDEKEAGSKKEEESKKP